MGWRADFSWRGPCGAAGTRNSLTAADKVLFFVPLPPREEVPLLGPADLHCCSQWHSISAAAPWQPLQEAEPGKAALLCFLRIMLCNWLFNHCLTWDSEIPHYLATRVTFNENKPIFVGENDSYTLKRWLKAQTQQIYFEKTLCKSLGEKKNKSPKSGRKSIVDVAPQKPTLFCLPAMKTKETPTSLRRKETFWLCIVFFFCCLFFRMKSICKYT